MSDVNLLNTIVQDTAAALVASSKAEAVATGAAQKQAEISNANAELLSVVATNQATIIATQETAKLNAQKATLRVANAAGVDPTAAGDVLTETMGKIATSNQEINTNLDHIDRLADVSIFKEGPVAWIKAKIDTVGLRSQVDREVQKNVVLNQQLTGVNQSIQQAAQTQNAIKETTTAASVQASAANAAALALIESNNARIQGLKYNVAEVDAAMNASKDRLGLLYNAQNAVRQEALLTKQLDALALSKEEFEWRKREKDEEQKAKAAGKEVDEYTVETINIGRAARGVPPLSGVAAKSQLQLFKAGGSKEMKLDYENGERTRIAGIPILGATPAESVAFLEEVPADIAASREATVATLRRARELATGNMKLDKKDSKAVADFINKTVRADVALQYSRVQSGTDNIFDIGDVGSYIGLRAVKDLPVVTKVLQPAFDLKQPLADPKIVFGLVSSAVKSGTITSSQAADLATVYQAANSVNIASKGLTGFGITVPQNGKAYNAAFGVGKTVNMTDPQAIIRLLSQDLAGRMYQTYQGNPVNVQFAPRRQITAE